MHVSLRPSKKGRAVVVTLLGPQGAGGHVNAASPYGLTVGID
jgi:hypothetical protein